MKISEIKLGQEVKDLVTGMTGIVMYHLKFLNGCHQLGVQDRKLSKEGETKKFEYFDTEQLEIVGEGIRKKLGKVKTSGGVKSSKSYPDA